MAEIVPQAAQTADAYEDRITAAVKMVLVEIGQILGSFRGKFAVVGGSVPWLLLEDSEMEHVGTVDVDLNLHAEALQNGEYADLIGSLMANHYDQTPDTKDFQLRRLVPARDGGEDIDVRVDFLMPANADIKKNKPKYIENFRVQRADGGDLATQFHQLVAIEAEMPDGGRNRVEIAVCSIPVLLAMKGYALQNRLKRKDAYDIYFCVRNYPEGVGALAAACQDVLAQPSGKEGYRYIGDKFAAIEGYGPDSVRKFVEDTRALEGRTPDQWQQDAFGQVNAWLDALHMPERQAERKKDRKE
jgi:hypothetical protein